MYKFRIDLRDASHTETVETLDICKNRAGYLLTAWQWSALQRVNFQLIPEDIIVVVPDFLYYARLASTGQTKAIVQLPESQWRVIRSAITCIPTGVKNLKGLAGGDFWAAAKALLAFDMGLLGPTYKGEVLLQYNLSDFAWLFDKESFLQTFTRGVSSYTRWGIATQQVPKALSACARWQLQPQRIMLTTGFKRPEASLLEVARKDYFKDTQITVDVTQWPTEMLTGDHLSHLWRDVDDEWLVSQEAGRMLYHSSS